MEKEMLKEKTPGVEKDQGVIVERNHISIEKFVPNF
jgi:hypothetical protein